jgi:hypothetical protein
LYFRLKRLLRETLLPVILGQWSVGAERFHLLKGLFFVVLAKLVFYFAIALKFS